MSAVSIDLEGTERRRPRAFMRLYHGQTRFDFVRRRRWWFGASAVVIAAGLVSLGVKGLNYSIEFVGGTSWQVLAPGVTVAQAQSALTPLGFGGSTITVLGSGSTQSLNVEAKLAAHSNGVSSAQSAKVATALGALGAQASLGRVDRIRRADLGQQHHPQGGRSADRLPHRDRCLHLAFLRVEDGAGGDRRGRCTTSSSPSGSTPWRRSS